MTDKPVGMLVANKNEHSRAHRGEIVALAFSSTGKYLASAAKGDLEVRVWDIAAQKELHALKDSWLNILGLAFSPDGKYLATAGKDRRLRIYDVEAGFRLRDTLVHPSPVIDVVFYKDGTLASCTHEAVVRLWDAEKGREKKSIVIPDTLGRKLAFSPTEPLLAIACDHKIVLWNIDSGEQREIARSPGMVDNKPFIGEDDKEAASADPKSDKP